MKRVTFHKEAESELIEAAHYYEMKTPGLGLSFLLDVEESIEKIRDNPDAFKLVASEIHCKRLRRFPYNVMYALESDRIRILAVAHQRRRPGYWHQRSK